MVEVVLRAPDGTTMLAGDGAAAPLTEPPQGGEVLFISVRARNLDTCAVDLVASVRDLCDARVRLEGRPVNLTRAADGWAYPTSPTELDNFANVGVCPNTAGVRDLYGEPYRVEVTITDKAGRQGAAAVQVVPYCAEPDRADDCACTCAARYVLGSTCAGPRDAGPGGCPPGDAGVGD